jgi:hypothetical protein
MSNPSPRPAIPSSAQQYLVAFVLFACASCLAVTPLNAQTTPQKKIVGLKLGEASEGSRVTIVSDTALNDYEAFRRNDRFYVKIPVAAYASTVPQLRADGFENVQVRKSADGVIVSFRMQPGATARVDQRLNQLDVIFSAPNRVARDTLATSGSQESFSSLGGTMRIRRPGVTRSTRIPPGSQLPSDQPGRSDNTNSNFSVPANAPLDALRPLSSSSASPSSPPSLAAPTAPSVSNAVGNTELVSARNVSPRPWIAANRPALLLGGLIVFGLVVYRLVALRRRRVEVVLAMTRPGETQANSRAEPGSRAHFDNPIATATDTALPAPQPVCAPED